ncbi:MAG: peptide-methionine (S)-S-oxide reductase MsrA [Bacteroidales bacterium]|jgi:peptide methionine sulfoxide reductase msrA/msrB|nr:peptide-methionine (S)-S-oxide reductase MsrA [Bacteroidales bacterium]
MEQIAIFAGGCFWGVEHLFRQLPGVMMVISGYTGGNLDNPTYEDVCSGLSGHAEAVQVTYDPSKISYRELATYFFEIHDPEQIDRQGPDRGTQYRSEIFYTNEEQKTASKELISILNNKGYRIATKVTPASKFYPAENYHQRYYQKKGGQPYCHSYKKRF